MRRRTRHRLQALFIAGLVLLMVATLVPWKGMAEQKISLALAQAGISPVRLSLSRIRPRGLDLEKLTIGDGPKPLVLEHLVLRWTLADLWNNRLRELRLSGLHLEAVQTYGRWSVRGLESLLAKPGGPFALPVSAAELAPIALDTLSIDGSSLSVSGESFQADAPFTLKWHKTPLPAFDARGTALVVKAGSLALTAPGWKLETALEEESRRWKGHWEIGGIRVAFGGITLPALQAAGSVQAFIDRAAVSGKVQDAKSDFTLAFEADLSYTKARASKLFVSRAGMAWGGGRVSAKNVTVPLGGGQPVKATLGVDHVSLEILLKSLLEGRAQATGALSGELPLSVRPSGALTLLSGTLEAEGPGVIRIDPKVIPGDNEQVALLRSLLEDLHYSALSVTLSGAGEDKVSARLFVQGYNPQVYGGKAVKLNVHLSGDVLAVARQSALTLAGPKTLLEQTQDAQ